MARRGKRGTRPPKVDLSRDERAAYGGEAGFAPRQYHVRCSSCRDNELSPPGVDDPASPAGKRLGRRRSFRCEECDGAGVVSATHKQGIDQYMIPKRG